MIKIILVFCAIGFNTLKATQPIIETEPRQDTIVGIEIKTKQGLLKAAYAVEIAESKYKLFGGFYYYENGKLKMKGDSVIVDIKTKIFTNAKTITIY